eukprot:TRINITY_DN1717_c0_g1_i3.p1 TRINITY_DN1717_c0_g1~~TRINITY_DN1717_c0_g1_i3.p1  ORF type:complete len:118 (-),score=16.82 TRINITY_DN1717_c0_g1_i3:162-515(-)
MHKVCSTLLTSLEEIFKAIRRKCSYTVSAISVWVASRIIKHTAKFYTKDELEELRKDTDDLNAAMTKAYRKFAGLFMPGVNPSRGLATQRTAEMPSMRRDEKDILKARTIAQKGFNP